MPAPDLYPIPFPVLVGRMSRELEEGGDLYYLPRRSWWTADPEANVGIDHLGRQLATPAGPASGPHTQLAQNLLLSWLAGGRFMELKTVQVDDELVIPRPCIHVPHVGYNVEWSQELRVPQSAEEYVKGWMLVHMLAGPNGPGLWPGVDCIFDVSIGYDLEGIQTPKVRRYLEWMRDPGELIDRLLDELPSSLAQWKNSRIPRKLSDSITISTFHGCPAHEIEAIAAQTLDWGWHTVVKLNPTLLGHTRVRELLDETGYDFVDLTPEAFEKDLQWDQLTEMIPRLKKRADAAGLHFGVKFTNTLVHHSKEPPFGDGEMYLSGAPLHLLAFLLAARFRQAFPDPDIAITFSAGVDPHNFADCVVAGLQPVTSCSDLLKGRGYARMTRYVRELERRMKKAEVPDIEAYRRSLGGDPDAASASRAVLLARASTLSKDPRITREKNQKAPRKIDSELVLLDCLTCDKCIPVCPNAANFGFEVPVGQHQPGRLTWQDDAFEIAEGEPLIVEKKHQIGNTAEACNLCGQCDVWCPETGGPYLVKPTLFLGRGAFDEHPSRDGFFIEDDGASIYWRRAGATYRYTRTRDGCADLETPTGQVRLTAGDTPVQTLGSGEVDLRVAVTMRLFLDALTAPTAETWLRWRAGI